MVLLESQIKLKKGDIAPEFELLGIDDKKQTLKDYQNYKKSKEKNNEKK